eukprot:gnl/TRDRNA2_/TRDRNA2_87929_c0_seq2.p1 gnl/TRDRNA2_/TRDRNA2_87929_c0~~gnl/TRDRNA2_/TRDRNA2_87929_c0_seq2.p1  ORF type:complete len:548 (+),score=97.85 gnl/TRDRNA2_/TRDRNA2_87929_c0_seq2:105-1646(+)
MLAHALREQADVRLTVVLNQTGRDLRRLTGTVRLQQLTLRECCQFAIPEDHSSGFEVIRLHEPLVSHNAARHQEGASCTQLLEVGDRVVSVNGHTDITQQLAERNPAVFFVRWRPTKQVCADSFEVILERAKVEDAWGMQLRLRAEDKTRAEVRQVVPGAASLWNEAVLKGCQHGRTILAGDRVLAVNDREELQEMSQELRSLRVKIRLERLLALGLEPLHKENGVLRGGPQQVPQLEACSGETEGTSPGGWDFDLDLSVPAFDDSKAEPATEPAAPEGGASGWDVDPGLVIDTSDADTVEAATLSAPGVPVHCRDRDANLGIEGSGDSDRQVFISQRTAPPMAAPPPVGSAASPEAPVAIANSMPLRHNAAKEEGAADDRLSTRRSCGGRQVACEDDSAEYHGLCVIAGEGAYSATLDALILEFRQICDLVIFFQDAQLQRESLLIAFPKHSRCVWLAPGSVDAGARGQAVFEAARQLLWRLLGGEILSLTRDLESPSEFQARLSRCRRLPA